MTRKILGLECLVAVLTLIWPAESARAQSADPGVDFLNLSIEELMTVDAVGINVLGTLGALEESVRCLRDVLSEFVEAKCVVSSAG